MGDLEKQETVLLKKAEETAEGEEKERLLEGSGMAVVDFDLLCSTVALQTQGKLAAKLQSFPRGEEDGDAGDLGGVFRRKTETQGTCVASSGCGKGALHLILVVLALLNGIAFIATKKQCFLYLAVAFTISLGTYLGYFRTQIKKKFNIRGSDSSLDDCIYHLICPCCALCQESRTLEMNNVQDGTWHGRGDTICIGSLGEGAKSFFELQPPPIVSIKSPDLCSLYKSKDSCEYPRVK